MSATRTPARRIVKWTVPAALLAAAFTLVGCLTLPLGDPETSKTDPTLVGVWLNTKTDGDVSDLLAVQQYDPRTYLVTDLKYTKTNTGITPKGHLTLKAWLTPVGNTQFVTAEIKDPKSLVDPPDASAYVVAKLTRSAEHLTLLEVSDDFVKANNPATPADLAKLIAANLDNPKLFSPDVSTYIKSTPAQNDELKPVFDAFADPTSANRQASTQDPNPGL